MKMSMKDDKIVIYLNNTSKIDFKDNKKLEIYFKKLFNRLTKICDIDINGYYNIDVYKDTYYGIIIEIEKLDLDYYSYFNEVEMKINILNNSFLYEIDYNLIDKELKAKTICYKDGKNFYLKVKTDIDNISLGRLLEYGNVIYDSKIDDIIKYSKKVNI